MESKLLTKGEVADRLDVSIRTVNRLLQTTDLPRIYLSRRSVRIPEGKLERWLEDRTQHSLSRKEVEV